MKIAVSSALFVSLLSLFAYAVYSNNQMYADIERKLSSEPIFKKNIGKFQKAILVHKGTDCDYSDILCSESRLEFKVFGTHGCIYADAFVKESFPTYELVSISPSTYTSQNTTNSIKNEPIVTLIRECVA